jgi:hypothetical protein
MSQSLDDMVKHCSVLRKHLDNIENTKSKIDKIIIVCDLFQYLNNNIDFVKSHEKFKKCVATKINQFRKEISEGGINDILINNDNKYYIDKMNYLFDKIESKI